ncbi:MAG: DUF6252 family protein [Leadbetterella sp.]
MKFIITIILSSILLLSCDAVTDVNPADIISCKINGKEYKANGKSKTKLSFSNSRLVIGAENMDELVTLIIVYPKRKIELGEFEFKPNEDDEKGRSQSYASFIYPKDGSDKISDSITGKCTITKFENNSISGTFQYETYSGHKITEGKFDFYDLTINYQAP